MENTLALKIAKYYKKDKNKIIFTNGMNLNQMAMEMWEKLGFREVDASVLSRVINSERLFTPSQLTVFSKLLKIKNQEHEELRFCLLQDLASRFGLGEAVYEKSQDESLAFFYEQLEKINKLEEIGELELATEWISHLHETVKSELSKNHTSAKIYMELTKLLGRIVFSQLNILNQHGTLKRIAEDAPALMSEMVGYSKVLKEKEFMPLADYLSGAYYYTIFDYAKSAIHYQKALAFSALDPNYELRSIRTLALDFAYLNNRLSFAKTEKKLKEMLPSDRFTFSWKSEALEGLARSQAILGKTNFDDTLQEGWNIYKTLNQQEDHLTLRKLQLSRTEIECFQRINSTSNGYFEDIGFEALREARKYGFNRHAKQIWDLLNNIL